jgi:hypothetical protein
VAISGSESFSIPDKVVSQMAEFVYNLTSRPIPRYKSKKVQSLVDLMALAIQVDGLSDLTESLSSRSDTDLEVTTTSTSTWAQRQFWTWRLLNCKVNPAMKPVDKLHKMLLQLAWLRKTLSKSDVAPFVLHYWDLRTPNIIIDDVNNIAG